MSASATPTLLSQLPPQSAPPLTGNAPVGPNGADVSRSLWDKLWYIFLHNVAQTLDNGAGFTAGGDLAGTDILQTVIGLQGVPISSAAPTASQVLAFIAGLWTPTTLSVVPGAATIDYHTISGALAITASVMPAPTNGLLRVFLTMASGAVQPTWSSTDFSLAPGAISILIGTRTVVCFCADGAGKWAMEAPPVAGR